MRIKRLHYILLVAAWFLLTAKGCETEMEGREKSFLDQKIKTIEKGLESEIISENAKVAYERKAKEMLLDFADYYSIFSDRTMDSIFRNNTRNLMSELFTGDSITLGIKTEPRMPGKTMKLSEFLNETDISPFTKHKLIIEELQTTMAPERRDEKTYYGKLSFLMTHVGINPGDTVLIESSGKECSFYIIKVNKTFGQETKSVWQVFLGKIK